MNRLASILDFVIHFPYLVGAYRDVPALLLLPWAAASRQNLVRRLGQSSRWLTAAAVSVAAAVALAMLVSSAAYLSGTGWLDHVEASVAAVSWWAHTGHPMYPDWSGDGGVYGFVYGPLLFQITGAALSWAPSILLSKLPGFCCFWLACGVVIAALRPVLPSVGQSLLPAAVLILVAGGYWRVAYWDRPDAYMLLFAALALLSWRRLDRNAAAATIGLLGGAIVNLKIHGLLYILPYAVALLAAENTGPARIRLAIIGITSGIPTFVLPLLDPNVSLLNYIGFVGLALHHGLDRLLLMWNIRLSLVLMLPAVFLVWRHIRGQPQPDLPMALAYCMCVAVVCCIGAKKGAGPGYLLPLLPGFIFLLFRLAQPSRVPANDAGPVGSAIYFLALAIAYLPSFGSNLIELQMRAALTDNPAVRDEAKQLYAAYPTAAMGVGDQASFNRTQYKAVGVFAGGPLVFDVSTWMDLQGAGVPDDMLTRLLTDCRTRFWIIPNGGEPFTLRAAYSEEPLFSDRFRALFRQAYQLVRVGEFYSVWGCR